MKKTSTSPTRWAPRWTSAAANTPMPRASCNPVQERSAARRGTRRRQAAPAAIPATAAAAPSSPARRSACANSRRPRARRSHRSARRLGDTDHRRQADGGLDPCAAWRWPSGYVASRLLGPPGSGASGGGATAQGCRRRGAAYGQQSAEAQARSSDDIAQAKNEANGSTFELNGAISRLRPAPIPRQAA